MTVRPARLLALLATLAPAVAVAQRQGASASSAGQECDVVLRGVRHGDSLTRAQMTQVGGGQYVTWVGGGVDARCRGTDQRILSDSAEHYGDQKRLVLIGHVHYTEKRLKLDADRMTYFTADERLIAEGNVVGVTASGTRFTGPRAEYLRAAPGVRPQSRLDADSRPTVWMSPADASGGSRDSVRLQADHVISENDSLVYASGRVVIERPDIEATGDSAFMDNGQEFVQLMRAPKVVGRGERKFTLEGALIDTWSKNRQVERVKSSGNAKATSDDVTLTADTIDLRVKDQKLVRAYAWGPKRALAHSQERDVTADSIDVVMPGQKIREMRAVRRALAESPPDTAKIISKQQDWLRGDTIVAHFDTAATADSSQKPSVRKIVATGNARSFYQVAPSGAREKTTTPSINYVTGRQIVVDFQEKQVQSVTVKDQAAGFYVEAEPDSTRVRRDSAGKAAPTPPAPKGKKL